MRVLKLLPALLVVLFLFGKSQEAEAQVQFGPQVAFWDFEEIGVGGKVQFGLGEAFGIDDGPFAGLYGSFDGNYILADGDATPLLFNLNAGVPFQVDAAITPYAGVGINHWRISGGDEQVSVSFSASGLNLLGGLEFDMGAVPAFGQLAYSTSGAGFLTISGGVLFGG